jgi:ADP-dependent NAD(P)H-hydrate dehydratase / NAD(P)H-hydrate epimerase
MRVASSAEMAGIDRSSQQGIPGIVLMENAGARALAALRALGLVEPVVFVAGRGNNGGDALVMARHAFLAGMSRVSVLLASGTPAAGSSPAANLAACSSLGIEVHAWGSEGALQRLARAAWIVDGVAGTGLEGPLRAPLDRVVEAINAAPARRAALDVPSGLRDGWLAGEPMVRADCTVTIGLPKRCLYLPRARAACGVIRIVDPGFPPALLRDEALRGDLLAGADLQRLVPALPPDTHKNRRGHLAVFAGAPGTTGAAWLAAHAAARARTGLVTLHAAPEVYPVLAPQCRSVMVRSGSPSPAEEARYTAFLAGPGWGRTDDRRAELARLLRGPLPGVLDADALALATDLLEAEGLAPGPNRVLTPHPGEAARLLGRGVEEILRDPLAALATAGPRLGCTIVLKGHVTVVWSAGRFAILDGMNPALATGGSGDVLAGAIAGLLACGLGADTAARAGVLVHAAAAVRALHSAGLFLAEDLVPEISRVLAFCAGGAPA